jgi:hypothetical protein
MRKAGWITLVVAILVGAFLLTPFGRIVILAVLINRDIAAAEAKVTAPAAYQPAAVALARLCQSDPTFYSDDEPWPQACTPVEVLKLRPLHMRINPEFALVEFGGGLGHFGYKLELDDGPADEATNHWTLNFYTESRAKPIYRFTLPKSEHIELSAFIDGAMAEYHRRAAEGPLDDDVRARLKFLLKHHQSELAIQSIDDFAARYPHDWLDQLLRFVTAAPGDKTASDRLEQWASAQNDYTNWLFAAFAYAAVGDADAADRCSAKAVRAKPDDAGWASTNARCRGAPMCLFLYQSGRYATCLSLCNALLEYQADGAYLAPELTAIRDAAQQASQHPDQRPVPVLKVTFDPFDKVDVQLLKKLRAASARPTSRGATGSGH